MNYFSAGPGRASAGTYSRDPISVMFDQAARRLLNRAYASPGGWVVTRLVDPGPRTRAYAQGLGIDLDGPDPVPGHMAKTRYGRAFVRAVYHQHKYWSGAEAGEWRDKRRTTYRETSITVEVGRHIPASPQFNPDDPSAGGFPAGRKIRVMYQPDKNKARQHMRRLPDSMKAIDEHGRPAGRWSDPNDAKQRDW